MADNELAVEIGDAYKCYGRHTVINGLNLRIEWNSVLLGSSGCGKTTLLKCIVGANELDSGNITLDVRSKMDIGFMPQGDALDGDLSLSELFTYYSMLQDMPSNVLPDRVLFLSTLLSLPSLSTRIAQCSGGESKRVSMAVALLHDPQLLILDEPTAGVDVLLAQRIRKYLLEAVQKPNKKTVIITTHYIEEARYSTCVGMMRSGVLLAEGSPEHLIQSHGTVSLEQLFLELCMLSDKEKRVEEDNGVTVKTYNDDSRRLKNHGWWRKSSGKVSRAVHFKKPERGLGSNKVNPTRIRAQLFKNYKWTIRNLSVTLFTILLPAVNMILSCELNVMGGGGATGGWNIALAPRNGQSCVQSPHDVVRDDGNYSGKFINRIEKQFHVEYYQCFTQAKISVLRGESAALVTFPYNYSSLLRERIQFILGDGEEMDSDFAERSEIHVWMDTSNYLAAVAIKQTLYSSLRETLCEIFLELEMSSKLGLVPPMRFEEPIHGGGQNFNYIDSVIPGYYCCLLFYTTFLYTSSSLMMEKTSGQIERSRLSGLTLVELFIAHCLMQFAVMTLENVISLYVTYVLFSRPLLGSVFTIYLIITSFELHGIGYGLLVSLLLPKESLVSYIGVGTILSLFLLCGTIWPEEGGSWLLVVIRSWLPHAYGVAAYRDVALRGFTIFNATVAGGLLIMSAATALSIVLSYLLIKYKLGSL